MIETIDIHGETSRTVQHGRMAPIAHGAIMHALEIRSRGSYPSSNLNGNPTIDETGTVDMTNVINVLEERDRIAVTEQQERLSVRDLGITDEALKVHGVAPARKVEGIIHMIYENDNGINNRLADNEKVEKAK